MTYLGKLLSFVTPPIFLLLFVATGTYAGNLTVPIYPLPAITAYFDHTSPNFNSDGNVTVYDGRSVPINPDDPACYTGSTGLRGWTWTPTGECLRYEGHDSIDYEGGNLDVLASAPGIVREVVNDDSNTGLGTFVRIWHKDCKNGIGCTTLYAHLKYNSPTVAVDDNVVWGQKIGVSGSTGATGGFAHLHFNVINCDCPSGPNRDMDPYGWSGSGNDPWGLDIGYLWTTRPPSRKVLKVETSQIFYNRNFDGAGLGDIGLYDRKYGRWCVALSNGSAFVPNPGPDCALSYWADGWGLDPEGVYFANPLTGDFDGNGKEDLLLHQPLEGKWYVALSDGTRFGDDQNNEDIPWNPNWKPDDTNKYAPVLTGDFTGDGKDDIALFEPSTGNWYVAKSNWPTSREFVDLGTWLTGWGAGDPLQTYWRPPLYGDFTGDGKQDIGLYSPDSGNWYVSISKGTYFERNDNPWLPNWGVDPNRVNRPPIVGDFDQTGRADVANYNPENGKWWVALSTGNGFQPDGEWGIFGVDPGRNNHPPISGWFNTTAGVDLTLYNPSVGGTGVANWWVAKSDWPNHRFVDLGLWLDNWGNDPSRKYFDEDD